MLPSSHTQILTSNEHTSGTSIVRTVYNENSVTGNHTAFIGSSFECMDACQKRGGSVLPFRAKKIIKYF